MADTKPAQQTGNDKPNSSGPGKGPVDKFSDGPLHVSIWENQGLKGAFRTASFELRYKKGEEWQTGHSYGSTDLAHLENAAKEARSRIEVWQKELRPSPNPRLK